MVAPPNPPPPGWAALIAARMPRAASQRVRANRRLRQTGAIAVRPGVYALPDTPAGRESLAEASRELARQKGSGLGCLLAWLDPLDDEKLRARYTQDADRKRQRLLTHIHRIERMLGPDSRLQATVRRTANARLARLRKHLGRVSPEAHAAPTPAVETEAPPQRPHEATPYRGRVWVTRRGVLVDRIASAWLIQRFIDRAARFRFVSPGEELAPGELRFDMADAEFTHESDRYTFETLVGRFRPDDPALQQLGEIVHDLDLRDGKFGRSEAPGVARVIAGLAAAQPDDAARIDQGRWLFDCLYSSLQPGPAPQLPKGVLP